MTLFCEPFFSSMIFQMKISVSFLLSLVVLLWFAVAVNCKHYYFREEADAIIGSHMVHIAIPIDIGNLTIALKAIAKLSGKLKKLAAKSRDNGTFPQLSQLASMVEAEHARLFEKYSDVEHFFTKHEGGSERSSSGVQLRRIERSEQDEQDTELYLDRNKRVGSIVGFGITALIGALGFTTLFGMYSGEKIRRLGDDIGTLERRQDAMITLIEGQSEDIMTNRMALKELSELVRNVTLLVRGNTFHSTVNSMVMSVETEIRRVDRYLDLYIRIVQGASQHRMAFGVLSKEGAMKVFQNITAMATDKRMKPVISHSRQLMQLSTSFLISKLSI